jgi:lipoprotein-releasing system permease protein
MLKFKLALRYLLRKPITLFAVISVLLGTTAFVVVIGVMDGYVNAFNERSRMILSDMVIRPSSRAIAQPDELIRLVKSRVRDVVECSPNIMGTALIKIRGFDGTFTLKWCQFVGIDAPLERKVSGLDALGSVPEGSDDWIVPGDDLLEPRGPGNVSEIILVTSGRSGSSPPVKTKVKLASVVDFGLYQYDKEFAFISRKEAAKLTGLDPAWATEIRVRVRDSRRAEYVRNEIQAALDDLAGGSWQFGVYRYQETDTMFRALKLQRSLATLVLGCLFAAAGFAIVAICYMIVLQKTRDIGVLRTVGLSRNGVTTVFVTYGCIAGMAGVALGIALGVFILDHVDTLRQTLTGILGHDPFPESLYGFKHVPHEVNFRVLLLISGIALAVSFLGSLYPARRAAGLNVVESLRYE